MATKKSLSKKGYKKGGRKTNGRKTRGRKVRKTYKKNMKGGACYPPTDNDKTLGIVYVDDSGKPISPQSVTDKECQKWKYITLLQEDLRKTSDPEKNISITEVDKFRVPFRV